MAVQAETRDLGLSVLGLGVQYPPHALKSDALDILSKRFYPDSPAMKKVLSINRYTGIDQRSSIGTPDHPLVNNPEPPTIAEIHNLFRSDGIPLAVTAARKALEEAHIDPSQITHVVSTTCTDSANPGYDHYVAKELNLPSSVEKVLLHGIGCSGGLAALRTAANLSLGHTFRGLPARILVIALEVSTIMVRSELDSIAKTQETRIGAALFSDCASAVVLSNNIGSLPSSSPVYSLLGWEHQTIPNTEDDLGFDVDPQGWKVVLSPRVPQLTQSVLRPAYTALMRPFLPSLPDNYQNPPDFDWAMHPGGALILTGAEKVMKITPEHMRASYDTYINHGNSSSATIFSVLDRLRQKDMDAIAPGGKVKDYVVGCAFGPGITVEMCLFKRNLDPRPTSGLETPPETESEASEDSDDRIEVEDEFVAGADKGISRQQQKQKEQDVVPETFIAQEIEGLELD
ncbi:chalcone synthase [Podospora australis]|uniref:Chalcone synthase n=1 Tax=Podospora australis TaxID=1536484 RepID=A0AAN6WVW8_9PEZI|nr:chalcone synthase [Podospora australis]